MILLLILTVLVAGAAVTARLEIASARTAVSASFGLSILGIGFLPVFGSGSDLIPRDRECKRTGQKGSSSDAPRCRQQVTRTAPSNQRWLRLAVASKR